MMLLFCQSPSSAVSCRCVFHECSLIIFLFPFLSTETFLHIESQFPVPSQLRRSCVTYKEDHRCSKMRRPRLLHLPRLALLFIIATTAAAALLWSRRYLRPGAQQKMHSGSPRAKECLKSESLAPYPCPHTRIEIEGELDKNSFQFQSSHARDVMCAGYY